VRTILVILLPCRENWLNTSHIIYSLLGDVKSF
jgi:hypothetical protein